MPGKSPSTTRRRTPARRGSGESLRAEIIEAASDLLAETGNVATMSLRAVARRVGIATTSIYLHFADLDELVLAVKMLRFSELNDLLRSSVAAAGDIPVDRVRALGHAYVEFGMANPGHYRVMFSATVAPFAPAAPGLMIGQAAFDALAIEVAAALGLSTDDPQTHLVATSLWTFVHGVVHLRSARPHFPWPDLTLQIDDLVDRIIRPA